MSGLPAILQLIMLRDDLGQEFASRIEDLGDGALTVARPLDLPAEHRFEVDSEVFVTWREPTGVEVRPGRLRDVRREANVSLWDIELTGAGWREQRRSFVRAAVPGKVTLRWAASDGSGGVASCPLLDLSEAALRCRTTVAELATAEAAGRGVRIELETPDKTFELTGEVLRGVPDREPAAWQLVVVFTDPGKAADELRRIVFAQQLRDRRRGPASAAQLRDRRR